MVLKLPPINQNICILTPTPPSKAVYRLFADTLPTFLNLGKTEIGKTEIGGGLHRPGILAGCGGLKMREKGKQSWRPWRNADVAAGLW